MKKRPHCDITGNMLRRANELSQQFHNSFRRVNKHEKTQLIQILTCTYIYIITSFVCLSIFLSIDLSIYLCIYMYIYIYIIIVNGSQR